MIRYVLHYAPAKILPGLINFIGLTLYARIFTQEEYGRYAYVFATLGLVQSILFPWIRMSIARFYQKHKKNNTGIEYENFTLFIYLLVSMVLIFFWSVSLAMFSTDPQLKPLYFLGLLVILAQALFEQLMGLARAKLQSKVFLFSMTSKAIIQLSLVLTLVMVFNFNEKALFIGIVFAHVIPISFYLFKYFKLNTKNYRFNKQFIKETFHYGFPLTFTFLLVFIVNSSDRILIKWMLDEKSVGLYSIPYEFSTFTLTNIFMVFSMSFFPVIVRDLEENGYQKAKDRIEEYSGVMLTFVIPSTIFIIVLAPEISNLFLGENYNSNEAILIIQLISIASFLAGMKAYFYDYAFQLGKNTYMQIIPVIVAALLNIIFNIILLPLVGVIGAVIGTIASFLAGIIMSVILGRKLFKMTLPTNQLRKIIISNLLLLIVLVFIPDIKSYWINMLTSLFIGGSLYAILLFTFNIINTREVILNKFIRRRV